MSSLNDADSKHCSKSHTFNLSFPVQSALNSRQNLGTQSADPTIFGSFYLEWVRECHFIAYLVDGGGGVRASLSQHASDIVPTYAAAHGSSVRLACDRMALGFQRQYVHLQNKVQQVNDGSSSICDQDDPNSTALWPAHGSTFSLKHQ